MEIFIWALMLSILYSILFWGQTIGISGLIFTVLLIYITVKLLKEKAQNPKPLLISIPIILLSSTYFIFDNTSFRLLNLFVIPVLHIIMIIATTIPEYTGKSIVRKIFSMIIEPFNCFGEVISEFKRQIMKKMNIEKENQEKKERRNLVKALFSTGIIALIVLVLLISADSEFAKAFSKIEDILENLSIPSLAIRIVLIILMFFYISGFFINMLSKFDKKIEVTQKEEKPKENLTINMTLTVLNILYLAFCFVQIKSLFTIENIKYSSYARQGFFQLMLVSLINLVTILKATNKKLVETEKQKKYKKFMCIIMLLFTLIIIISSFCRMTLYQEQYGDTRLRILVDFILLTEVILLVPIAIYIKTSKINLAKSYLVIITIMYCFVNLINIDYIIAKRNIDRYVETGKIDLSYLIYELNTTDITKQLIRLKETEFKYSEKYDTLYERDTDTKMIYQNLLDKYLLKQKNAIKKKNTLPEFNLSRFRAKIMLKDVNINEGEM